jgi:hypothetical protein
MRSDKSFAISREESWSLMWVTVRITLSLMCRKTLFLSSSSAFNITSTHAHTHRNCHFNHNALGDGIAITALERK